MASQKQSFYSSPESSSSNSTPNLLFPPSFCFLRIPPKSHSKLNSWPLLERWWQQMQSVYVKILKTERERERSRVEEQWKKGGVLYRKKERGGFGLRSIMTRSVRGTNNHNHSFCLPPKIIFTPFTLPYFPCFFLLWPPHTPVCIKIQF